MSKLSDLIQSEVAAAEAAEADTDANVPSSVRATRGHGRSKVLQVRLNEDELRLIEKLAEEQRIPASTFARAVLLKTIGH